MKKEVGIAVFFGVLLGLVVAAFMISRVRNLETQKIKLPSESLISPSVKNLNSQIQTLEISEPGDQIAVGKNSVTLKGKTVKDSLIVVQTPGKDLLFKNKNENFSIDVPLLLGANVITIASYPKGGTQRSQEKTLTVFFLDEQ